MKLKLKNIQIVAMKLALDTIDNTQRRGEFKPFDFPAKGIYWIGRITSKVRAEFDSIEKTRMDLVTKYMEKQTAAGSKNQAQLEGQFLTDFSREYTAQVLEMQVEVEIPVLKLSYLNLSANSHFPTGVISDLDPIIEDDLPADSDQKK